MRVKDKVALVTGAGAGIGKASAILLAQEGARVGVADFDGAAAETTARGIQQSGGEAISIPGDVSIEADCKRMVEAVSSRWGQ